MEYFFLDPRVLARVNRHSQKGAKMPEETIQKLWATKKIFAGTELPAQLFYSAADQLYHSQLPLHGEGHHLLPAGGPGQVPHPPLHAWHC